MKVILYWKTVTLQHPGIWGAVSLRATAIVLEPTLLDPPL